MYINNPGDMTKMAAMPIIYEASFSEASHKIGNQC